MFIPKIQLHPRWQELQRDSLCSISKPRYSRLVFLVWGEHKADLKRNTGFLNLFFNFVYFQLQFVIYFVTLSEHLISIWELPHAWWSSVTRLNDGWWKSWAEGVEVFLYDTSQEVHVLGWGRANSIPACFVQRKPWLIVLINEKGRMWNAQPPSSLSLSNKQNCCMTDVNRASIYLWVVHCCQIRIISFRNLLCCYSFVHHTAPLS